jgi:hypothetical protein
MLHGVAVSWRCEQVYLQRAGLQCWSRRAAVTHENQRQGAARALCRGGLLPERSATLMGRYRLCSARAGVQSTLCALRSAHLLVALAGGNRAGGLPAEARARRLAFARTRMHCMRVACVVRRALAARPQRDTRGLWRLRIKKHSMNHLESSFASIVAIGHCGCMDTVYGERASSCIEL